MSMFISSQSGLAVERQGVGPPVIMLHGLGGTLNVWEPQVRALQDRFSLIRFDMRGSGRSPAQGPVSIESWVDDLAAVMNEQGVARARLVGHSLGTLVLQHFAAQYPERVEKMALIGVNRSPPEARRATVRERALEVRTNGMSTIVDGLIATVVAERTRREKPVVIAAIREMVLAQNPHCYAWTCEAMAASTRPDLSRVDVPLLLIAGAEDTVSPAKLSEDFADERRAKLVLIPESGHWLPLEQPDPVSSSLIDFL